MKKQKQQSSGTADGTAATPVFERPPPLDIDYTSAWRELSDATSRKRLSKLIEECSELITAASRCLQQGIDSRDPDSGQVNIAWLQDEIADVAANIELVYEHFRLDTEYVKARIERKKERQLAWQAP